MVLDYTFERRIELNRNEAFEEGLAEGKAKGRAEGLAEGVQSERLRIIAELLKSHSVDEVRNLLSVTEEEIQLARGN